MSVLHDFMCKKHGVFESREEAPACPMKGCEEEVFKVFLKPVAVKSDATKRADHAVESLALDFGMSNIQSTREGDHQSKFMQHTGRAAPPAAPVVNNFAPRWGAAQAGSLLNRGIDMNAALRGGVARPVLDESVGASIQEAKQRGELPPVRPSVVMRDHENLTLPK